VRVDDETFRIPRDGVSDLVVGLPATDLDGILRRGGGVSVAGARFFATDNGDLRIETTDGPIIVSDVVGSGGLQFRIDDAELPLIDFTLPDGSVARLRAAGARDRRRPAEARPAPLNPRATTPPRAP
jgi:hypothetical protein